VWGVCVCMCVCVCVCVPVPIATMSGPTVSVQYVDGVEHMCKPWRHGCELGAPVGGRLVGAGVGEGEPHDVAVTRIGNRSVRHAHAYCPFAPPTIGSPLVSEVQVVVVASHAFVVDEPHECRVGATVGLFVGIMYVEYLR
jgi:hypothetical protein